jgi:hypothetical protein
LNRGDLKDVQRAAAEFQDLIRTGSPEDRMWAYGGLGLAKRQLGDIPSSIEVNRAGAAQYPHFPLNYGNLSTDEHDFEGHDEQALADARTYRATMKDYGRSYLKPDAEAAATRTSAAREAEVLGDYAAAADGSRQTYLRDPLAGNLRMEALVRTAQDHASLAAVRASAPLPRNAVEALSATADEDLARLTHAFALGDWAGTVEAYNALDMSQLTSGDRASRTLLAVLPAAVAKARLGQSAQAQALIATTPLDCYRCVDARGAIASATGDWAGADRWFAEAERQGPSLPFAYADQAQSRLARGDTAGAIALLQTAYTKSPHYADGLELWGEALARRGDYAGAAAKYAEADRYAPQWGRNHLMWAEAQAKSGKAAEARTQKQIAAGLDLSAADRAELDRLRI